VLKSNVVNAKIATWPKVPVTTRPDLGWSCEIADEACHANSERPSQSVKKAAKGS
jgi:hypothetical protein